MPKTVLFCFQVTGICRQFENSKDGDDMPRPKKWRRVCRMPGSRSFGPLDGGPEERRAVAMTVDEFEAVRLIDLEGMTQEECAERMAVSRTTAQAIYNSARVKLAQCLVNGTRLTIGGGDYILCEGEVCGCVHCRKRKYHSGEEEK